MKVSGNRRAADVSSYGYSLRHASTTDEARDLRLEILAGEIDEAAR
jgi:hypothetical protein